MSPVRIVEGWRSKLTAEAEQARRALSGKPSKDAKERYRKLKQKIDRLARRDDAKEQKRLAIHRAHQVLYRKRHPDRCRESERRWREKNKEKALTSSRMWRAENKERVRESKRKWNKKNKGKVAAHQRAHSERKRLTILEQRVRESGGAIRRLSSQLDGRRLTVDVFRNLLKAGIRHCRANHTAKVDHQAEALIRAWDELALRGSRQAAVGFCALLTDMIGARRLRNSAERYETMEIAGKLRQWPANL